MDDRAAQQYDHAHSNEDSVVIMRRQVDMYDFQKRHDDHGSESGKHGRPDDLIMI